jgi:hypothetical protein
MSGSSSLRHGKAESRTRIASTWPSLISSSIAISAGLPSDTALPMQCCQCQAKSFEQGARLLAVS